MKWNVHDDSPPLVGRGAHIFLDGEELRDVRAFDTEAGWVAVLVLNEKGQAQVDASGNEVLEETLHGTVTIEG